MLLFRSEEHVTRWCTRQNVQRGATLALTQQRQISYEWFEGRLSAAWRRWPVEEIEAKFARTGLTGEFWRLR